MEKFFYRVINGETVNSLCAKFNLPTALFIKENNLTKEIEDGEVVVINKYNCKLYTVLPLDTIKSIAKRFNVSEEELKEKNKIDFVYYGLKILI